MAAWQDPATFTTWLIIVLVVIILLVGFILLGFKAYHQRIIHEQQKAFDSQITFQKELVRASVQIQEDERKSVAMELHDHVVSRLHGILFGVRSEAGLDRLEDWLQQCIDEARNISHEMHPPLLEVHQLGELIRGILDPLQGQYQVRFYELGDGVEAFPNTRKLHVIRILQELLTNIIKHAQASEIEICLKLMRHYCLMQVKDDGAGFDPAEDGAGLGMKNIEMRMQLMQGKYRFRSKEDLGTTFTMFVSVA